MRKIRTLDEKSLEKVKAEDALVHGISYLDAAATIAFREGNIEALIQLHKASLKTADRILSMEVHFEGENDERVKTAGFGFVPFEATESECESAEDDE